MSSSSTKSRALSARDVMHKNETKIRISVSSSTLADLSSSTLSDKSELTTVSCMDEFIDNSKRIYTPNKLRCGVTVQVGDRVLEECPTVLEDLNNDLASYFNGMNSCYFQC